MHPLQLVVGLGAQVAHQIPGGLVRQIVAQEPEKDPQQIQAHQDRRQLPDGLQPLLGDTIADDARHPGEDAGRRQVDDGQTEGGEDGDHVQFLVPDRLAGESQE